MSEVRSDTGGFPISAGVLFGLGLGGFFDGIVLHQLLQWHHMLTSAGYPPDSVENLKVNTFWDGLFHASTYVFTGLGLLILWRLAQEPYPVVRQVAEAVAGPTEVSTVMAQIDPVQRDAVQHTNRSPPPTP